ncbi:hypothetical protein SESBI_17492 [Sesbania bispinosa]|nr:hypothetical protein SESBI_17492 [Sesbania bispinosa]
MPSSSLTADRLRCGPRRLRVHRSSSRFVVLHLRVRCSSSPAAAVASSSFIFGRSSSPSQRAQIRHDELACQNSRRGRGSREESALSVDSPFLTPAEKERRLSPKA